MRINNYCKVETIEMIRRTLTHEQKEIFKQGPFASFLDWKITVFPVKLLWHLILRQCNHEDEEVIAYNFGGKKKYFTLEDFALITGLNCGKKSTNMDLMKKEKTLIHKAFGKDHPKVGELVWLFGQGEEQETRRKNLSDEDMVKLANLLLVERFVLSVSEQLYISQDHMVLADDVVKFNKHNWGTLSYKITVQCFRTVVRSSADIGIALKGFPYSVVIWAMEVINFMLEDDYVKVVDAEALPRMLKWNFIMQPTWADLNAAFEFLTEKEIMDMEPLEAEKKKPYMAIFFNGDMTEQIQETPKNMESQEQDQPEKNIEDEKETQEDDDDFQTPPPRVTKKQERETNKILLRLIQMEQVQISMKKDLMSIKDKVQEMADMKNIVLDLVKTVKQMNTKIGYCGQLDSTMPMNIDVPDEANGGRENEDKDNDEIFGNSDTMDFDEVINMATSIMKEKENKEENNDKDNENKEERNEEEKGEHNEQNNEEMPILSAEVEDCLKAFLESLTPEMPENKEQQQEKKKETNVTDGKNNKDEVKYSRRNKGKHVSFTEKSKRAANKGRQCRTPFTEKFGSAAEKEEEDKRKLEKEEAKKNKKGKQTNDNTMPSFKLVLEKDDPLYFGSQDTENTRLGN